MTESRSKHAYWLQVVASLAATISCISDGMHFGWSAPVIPILTSDHTPLKITKTDEKWLEILYLIGGMAGLPVTVYLVDKVGRKRSTILAACVSLTSWILIAIPFKISIYIGRFTCGLGADVGFVSTPMYIAEIADQKIRGLLLSLVAVMAIIGIILIYSVAPFTPYYAPSLVGIFLISLQLLTFSFMPESPYYLMVKNQVSAARRSLATLRRQSCNELELEEIREAVERHRKEHGGIFELLRTKINRKALLIVSMLHAAQHFCGISVMMMNMHTILAEAKSIYFQAHTSAIFFAGSMLVAATLASFVVDRYGRRILMIVSSILTGLCLLSLAVYFNLQHAGYNIQSASWIPIAAVMTYAATFKMGLGLVPFVVTSEIFNSKAKAQGMGWGDIIYLAFGMLSIELYKYLSENFGFHVPFYVFSFYSFFTTLLSVFVLPETKGKSLEEIQMLLGDKSEDLTCDNHGKLLER